VLLGPPGVLPMEAWVNFLFSNHFYEAIMILVALAMSSLAIVATYSGWVDMGVPFRCFRSGYHYCLAISIRFSSCNDLDLPTLVLFSLGFPWSLDHHRWTIVLVIIRLRYYLYWLFAAAFRLVLL